MTMRIALLGTGLMGFPMSRNILAGGFSLTVWNRSRAKAAPLAADGATVAESVASAVAGADIVITMLENGPVVRDVLFEQGAVAALKDGAIVVDMSSIPPAMARAHAEKITAQGAHHLDAPVSGGVPGAEAATLAIMVGGDKALFDRVLPLFDSMGRATLVGPNGCGQLAKLTNQTIVGITITAVAEGLLLAAAGGADPKAVQQAISGGFADSVILQNHGGKMIDRRFLPGAKASVQLKDLNTICDTAKELGLSLPVAEAVRGLYQALIDHGNGEVDHSGVLLEEERLNAPVRLGTGADTRPD